MTVFSIKQSLCYFTTVTNQHRFGRITKEIKAIYRTFWSGMHHKKCERGGRWGGGGVGLNIKVCYFFTTSRGARVFFPTLKTFLFFFTLQCRILFFFNFGFAGYFFRFFDSHPLTFVMVHP